MAEITRQMLLDYIQESSSWSEMATVEKALRECPVLLEQMGRLREEVDRGEHTIGAIWRRERVSCPPRDQLGGYLLGAGDPELLDYIQFHVETIGCLFCQANLDDLKQKGG